MRFGLILAGAVLGLATSTTLGVSWNEGVNGELSGNRLSPTNIGTLPIGTHSITATTASGDLEYYRITIPAGTQISQITHFSYTGVDLTAFTAVQAGTTFTETNGAPNVANILGYTHFGTATVGTDILDNMGTGAGAIGFVPPLPGGGSYTFWTQQTGLTCTYRLDIVVTASTFPASTYAEGVNGELSSNRLAPTNMGVLAVGSNTLAGSSVSGDLDYVRIHVPIGSQLSQMTLTHFASEDDLSFIALQAGATFTETNGAPNVANILGYTHYGSAGAALVGTNILDNIGTGAGSIGFTPPLPAGDYTFWIQETNAFVAAYRFDFVVTALAPADYDELADGDLSGAGATPTDLGTVAVGSTSLRGTTVTGDLDYFRINVASGTELSQINLDGFVSVDDLGFIAVQSGTTFTESPGAPNVANILGYYHLAAAQLGTDILDNIGTGAGSIGFVPPLPAGDYTFWTQQTNADPIGYELEFVVQTVVAPLADYDEDFDGDLSGDRNTPTDVGVINIGSYTVRGITVFGDLDYWTINIPSGAELSQLVVDSYEGEDATAFIAIQNGTTFTETDTAPDVGNILGYTHFGPGAPTAGVGDDILDNMGVSAGSIGFTPPLPAGDYTFWTQQTGGDETTYIFELVVTAEPPPACEGDVTGDGQTNVSDFNIVASNFGLTVTPGTNGDLSGNGLVNVSDFNILAGDFGCVE